MALTSLLALEGQPPDPWPAAVAGVALALAFYLALVFGTLVVRGRRHARRQPVGPVDAIVVLGSRVLGDRVSPALACRIDKGLELLRAQHRQGNRPLLVLSGGKGTDETASESSVMARYAVNHGADPVIIRTEMESTNTAENLRLSTALLKAEGRGASTVFVTNDYHVLRTVLTARQQGIDGQVAGAATPCASYPGALLREFAALLTRSLAVYLLGAAMVCALAGWLTWVAVS